MELGFDPLENKFVRLEPLGPEHFDDLRAACDADPEIWTQVYSYSMFGEHFDPVVARLRSEAAQGVSMPYAVMLDGKCVGMSCFLAIDRTNRTLEIGSTYYRPDVRGRFVNPAAKRLLLDHAFQTGIRRVEFRVDAINHRSRAAVLKIGATEEGLLRRNRIVWTGRIRDTIVYSILDDEWPDLRNKLDLRLAAFSEKSRTG